MRIAYRINQFNLSISVELLLPVLIRSGCADHRNVSRLIFIRQIFMDCNNAIFVIQPLKCDHCAACQLACVKRKGYINASLGCVRREGCAGFYRVIAGVCGRHNRLPGLLVIQHAYHRILPSGNQVVEQHGVCEDKLFRCHRDMAFFLILQCCPDLRNGDSLILVFQISMPCNQRSGAVEVFKRNQSSILQVSTVEYEGQLHGSAALHRCEARFCRNAVAVCVFGEFSGCFVAQFTAYCVGLARSKIGIRNRINNLHVVRGQELLIVVSVVSAGPNFGEGHRLIFIIQVFMLSNQHVLIVQIFECDKAAAAHVGRVLYYESEHDRSFACRCGEGLFCCDLVSGAVHIGITSCLVHQNTLYGVYIADLKITVLYRIKDFDSAIGNEGF